MKQIIFALILISAVVFNFVSCKKKDGNVSTYNATNWGFKIPANFPLPNYTFENNAQTIDRFGLGRLLFYDNILSLNNKISCSSCHAPDHAFSDHNVALSAGIGGVLGTRNAPSLSNLAWYPAFMWDGGVNHIEVQPMVPLTSPTEMNETMANILAKLNANTNYKNLFKKAYDVDVITDQVLLQALAQFTSMLISADSKYDQYIAGTASFTDAEKTGLDIFRNKCAGCHTEPLFTNFSYENIGLDMVSVDLGRQLITQNPLDRGKFRVPSLRNVAKTYPYMHDGRFFTLSQVLDHHINGALNNGITDSTLLQLTPLTSAEKLDIIQFLNTLTDIQFMVDPSLADPTH